MTEDLPDVSFLVVLTPNWSRNKDRRGRTCRIMRLSEEVVEKRVQAPSESSRFNEEGGRTISHSGACSAFVRRELRFFG